MEPEEIDKIFKNGLSGLPVTPSTDAWKRLQQKMEPPKKNRSMWIYYAAASITLLIISGIWFFTNQNTLDNGTLATVNTPEASTSKPVSTEDPLIDTPEEVKTNEYQIAQAQKVKPEAIQKSTSPIEPAVKIKVKTKMPLIAKAEKPRNTEVKRPEDKATPSTFSPTLKTTAPEEKLALVNQDKPLTSEMLTPDIIEVTVKRDNPEVEERSELRENLARKTSLFKNIYKQARNLKNGDQVELASLGINTDKINLEKQEIKEKLNKVISL